MIKIIVGKNNNDNNKNKTESTWYIQITVLTFFISSWFPNLKLFIQISRPIERIIGPSANAVV